MKAAITEIILEPSHSPFIMIQKGGGTGGGGGRGVGASRVGCKLSVPPANQVCTARISRPPFSPIHTCH